MLRVIGHNFIDIRDIVSYYGIIDLMAKVLVNQHHKKSKKIVL